MNPHYVKNRVLAFLLITSCFIVIRVPSQRRNMQIGRQSPGHDFGELRMLVSPSYTLACLIVSILIVGNEMLGIITCSLVDQKTGCGAMGGGVCGFVFLGSMVSLICIVLLLLPEKIVSLTIRPRISITSVAALSTPPGQQPQRRIAPAHVAISRLRGFVMFGVLVYGGLICGLVLLVILPLAYNVIEENTECTTQATDAIFWISLITRSLVVCGLFGTWTWWLVQIQRYTKKHNL